MSQNVINVDQALALYQGFIQEQIQRTQPAFRNRRNIIVTLPGGRFQPFSYPEMLSEVQRRTAIGINQAILHAQARGYTVM